MVYLVRKFFPDENGAVTVDWVILTAAVVGIAIAAYVNIQAGSSSMANAVSVYLTETPLEDLRDGPD
jgi:Flp pilus assembly pilin Flp